MLYKGEYQYKGKTFSFSCRGPIAQSFREQDKVRMEVFGHCPRYARIRGTYVHDTGGWPKENFRGYLLFGGVGLLFLLFIFRKLIKAIRRCNEEKKLEEIEKLREKYNPRINSPPENIKLKRAFKIFLITLTLWYLFVFVASIIQFDTVVLGIAITAFYSGFIAMGWKIRSKKREKIKTADELIKHSYEIPVLLLFGVPFCAVFAVTFFSSPTVSVLFIGFFLMMIQLVRLNAIVDGD